MQYAYYSVFHTYIYAYIYVYTYVYVYVYHACILSEAVPCSYPLLRVYTYA